MKQLNETTNILKQDLYSYLNIDIYSEEVALFDTCNKVIEDISFTDDSLLIKINNNTIKYFNGATSIKDINILKEKKILSKTHIELEDDFIIYSYKIEGIEEELKVRCLKASLEYSIKSKDILLFYTYSMFFKKIKDIIINPKEITLILELIDSNTKEYKLINGKLKNKNNYLKGYFKNELIDFNLRYNDSGNYQFSCHIYKDDSYLPFIICFDDIKIIK